MNTKEVCTQLSVTPKMLRVYENQKLICPKRGENNYRRYSIDHILQIQIIVMLRNLGFTLREIKTILDFKKSKNDYLSSFYIQLKAVETKINELNHVKKRLNSTINEILSTEEQGSELINTIFAFHKNENGKTMYEEMVDRWNFDEMAVDYLNRYLKEDTGYLNSIKKFKEKLFDLRLNKTFLDVGGGTCNLWGGFPKDTNLTVLDKSLQMILIAKENLPWIHYILDDILVIEIEKQKKYDIVVSTFTLHHISYEQQGKAIRNMIDLCSNEGKIMILDRSFMNEKERELVELNLTETGNFDYLEIIKSEFFLIADDMVHFINYLGYQVESYCVEEQIWAYVINKYNKQI